MAVECSFQLRFIRTLLAEIRSSILRGLQINARPSAPVEGGQLCSSFFMLSGVILRTLVWEPLVKDFSARCSEFDANRILLGCGFVSWKSARASRRASVHRLQAYILPYPASLLPVMLPISVAPSFSWSGYPCISFHADCSAMVLWQAPLSAGNEGDRCLALARLLSEKSFRTCTGHSLSVFFKTGAFSIPFCHVAFTLTGPCLAASAGA